jgi:putative membrane protein
MPGTKRPSLGFFFYILWLRAAVNNLMPVARIGGEIVAARVMMKHGVRQSSAIASTVVELSLSIAAVFLFVLSGIFLLSLRISDDALGWKLAAGLLASAPIIGALFVVQRVGFFGVLDRIFSLLLRERWAAFAGNGKRLDRAVHAVYRRKKKILVCGFWQIMSWSSTAGEAWLGLHFLGHPLGFVDCFILEALIQGSVSVAFAVPGALGVQEAGFLFFGHLLGLPPDIAVALAMIRRCRDLLFYVPGLIVWQAQEGRWWLGKKRAF